MFVTLTLNPAIDLTLSVQKPLEWGGVATVTGETRTPGGKGINVAKMIAANGHPVVAGGVLGRAELPFYAQRLAPLGVAVRFWTVPFPTRTNLMVADGAGREIKLNRPGFPDLAYDEARLFRHLRTLAPPGTVVILSGSLPARFPADTYARLIRLLHERKCVAVLDTSGPPLAKGCAENPAVIKPNRRELEFLVGHRLASRAALQPILRRLMTRHEVVILSEGPRGAWFAADGLIRFAPSPEVRSVDTTGAGDALLGQFCADYFPARRLTPAIAARAVAAGAAAVEQRGTPPIALRRVEALCRRRRPGQRRDVQP